MIIQPVPSSRAIDLHDQILRELPRPPWLVEGSLLDDIWVVRTLDPTLVRKSSRRIRFDAVVARGSGRLTDPAYEHDRITAKLLCFYCLSPAPSGGITSSSTVAAQIVQGYYTFVRWRLAQGIPHNSSLTPQWIELLIATMRKRGVRGLLPEGLVQRYLEELRFRGERLPTYTDGGSVYLERKIVAAELGLDSLVVLHSKEKEALLEALSRENIYLERENGKVLDRMWRGKRRGASDKSTYVPFFNILYSLSLLFEFRHRLGHDPIPFAPLDGRSIYGLAKNLASHESDRTKTIPALQACYLIEQALIWVLRYGPEVKSVFDDVRATASMDLNNERKARTIRKIQSLHGYGPGSAQDPAGPWPIRDGYLRARHGEIAKGRPVFATVITELMPAACMIVIAAFAARRHQEIASLRAGCVSRDGSDMWLECWISKTVQAVDKIPIPNVVAKAIETLEWLSQAGRLRTGTEWIFRIDRPLGLGATGNDRKNIRRFANHVGVPGLVDGTQWWFSPHQFRRFFGIVYYHRYRFPHLVALSNFYRHFDPDMTRRYISEAASGNFLWASEERRIRWTQLQRKARFQAADRLQDFQEEGLNFRLDRYRAIASGQERASGFGGELLKNELEKLQQDALAVVEIGADGDGGTTLDQLLGEFAKDRRLEPNPLGHSYCKCTGDQVDLNSAACLRRSLDGHKQMIVGAPDPRFAADLTCSGCPHNVQLPENEPYWREMIEHEGRQKMCAPGTLLAELAAQRQAAASAHCDRCFE